MPLESQLVNVNFAGGMDEKTSDRYVVQGKLISLKNGRFRKVGEISKRFGNTLTATVNETLDMTYAAKLGSFEKELLVFDKYTDGRTFCSSYSSKSGQFERMGDASEAVVTEEDAHFDSAQIYQQDIATGGGVIVTVWSTAFAGTSGDVWYMIRDAATGTMVQKPVALTTATTFRKPRVCFCGTTGIIVYQNGANLVGHTVNSSTFAVSLGTNLRTNNTNYGDFEISGGSTKWVMVYQKTGGGADLVVDKYDNALALSASATSTLTPSVGPSTKFPITCHYTEDSDIWVLFVDNDAGGPTYRPVMTWFNASTMAETPAPIAMADYGGQNITQASIVRHLINGAEGAAYVFDAHEGTTNAANGVTHAGLFTRSGTTISNNILYSTRYIPWCSLGSKIISDGNRAYFFGIVGGHNADTNWFAADRAAPAYSVVLIDPRLSYLDSSSAETVRPVAVAAPRYALWDRVAMNAFPKGPCSVAVNSGKYITLARVKIGNGSLVTGGYRGPHGLSAFSADFNYSNKFQQASLGEFSCFASGVPMYYDGRTPAEIGFVHYPEGITVSFAGAAGALSTGDYAYCAVYVFYDERGNVHRSAPSVAIIGTAAATNTATVTVPTLHNTMRSSSQTGYLPRVGIEVYRTGVGATSGPFYLVNSIPAAMTVGARTVTVSDPYADTVISLGPKLYTTGGIVDNVCPPSFLSMVAHRGRLFGIDGKRVWFSKLLVSGEGPAFADEFTLDMDADLNLTALGVLDDKVIIFSRNTIHVLTGRGPDDTANGNDYEITKISADRGCTDPRSVVTTPMGLMFQTDVGIYLLTRGLELQFIGAEVQDKLDTYSFVTSAAVHPTEPVIYFTCNSQSSGGAGNGIRLVYDYDMQQWSYDALWGRQYGSTNIVDSCPIMSSAIVNGVYYWQDGRGYVYSESTDGTKYYDDGNTYVPTDLQLAPINLNGINGFQRARYVQLKVKDYTSPSLTFEGYSGDEAVATTSQTFTPAVGEMRVDITNQLASTFRIVLRDAQNGSLSTGKGISFVGISFEVGVHPRANRLAAANRKG